MCDCSITAVEPKKAVNRRIAVVALSSSNSVAGGCGIAIVRSKLSSGIQNPQEIEDRLGLNVLFRCSLDCSTRNDLEHIAEGAKGVNCSP